VLTAAHCFDRPKGAQGYRVRMGMHRLDGRRGATYQIDRMVRHEGYDKERHLHDIALVHFVADEQTNENRRRPVEAIRLYGSDEADEADEGVGPGVSDGDGLGQDEIWS
jgi:secreted trypsin-like serine protease